YTRAPPGLNRKKPRRPVLAGRRGDGASPQLHRRSVGADHQHRTVAAADVLVVKVDADDRVGAEVTRFLDHLVERHRFRLAQLLLVRPRAAADDISDAGEEVTDD